MSEQDLGKKVFFLYPPSVIRDEMVRRLIEQEFEVYMIKEISTANRLLHKYPESLCFVNLDTGKSESEWAEWITSTMNDPATATVGIGIVTYNSDEDLQKKYLMDIGIRCGFIKLKLGIDESTRILMTTLQANEAKGRRKFVRANCVNDPISMLNLRDGPIKTTGKLIDVSVVGFSCILDPDPVLGKNSYIRDIQLKLRASLVRVEAVIYGTREADDRTVYVMIFRNLDDNGKEKIRAYIQLALQSEIEHQDKLEAADAEAAAQTAGTGAGAKQQAAAG